MLPCQESSEIHIVALTQSGLSIVQLSKAEARCLGGQSFVLFVRLGDTLLQTNLEVERGPVQDYYPLCSPL